MPGSVLSTGDVIMYENTGPCLHGVVILVKETNHKISEK